MARRTEIQIALLSRRRDRLGRWEPGMEIVALQYTGIGFFAAATVSAILQEEEVG